MVGSYSEWCRAQGHQLYYAAGLAWRLYHRALVPVTPFPCLAELPTAEARRLLRESGALFVRFSSGPVTGPTAWWYMVAERYDVASLSSNTRSKIHRGRRRNQVRRINAEWLAEHGHPCYVSAHQRYRHARPAAAPAFREEVLAEGGGPFEHWGVFAEDDLVGYASCVVEGASVFTSAVTLAPAGLKDYSAYALFDALLSHYVAGRGMTMSNGTRAVSHDTQMQDFLLQFGYKRLYARLHIVYQPWFDLLVRWLYPARRLLRHIPGAAGVHAVKSVLYQEELRRRCSGLAH
jgi:hypothetical protein